MLKKTFEEVEKRPNKSAEFRFLFAGAGGMLGNGYHNALGGTPHRRYCSLFTDIQKTDEYISDLLDVRDRNEYIKLAKTFEPTHVFHLAAITDLEKCEDNPYDAYITNTFAVENAIAACKESKAKLIFIATAGTVDGKEKCYPDWFAATHVQYMGEASTKVRVL